MGILLFVALGGLFLVFSLAAAALLKSALASRHARILLVAMAPWAALAALLSCHTDAPPIPEPAPPIPHEAPGSGIYPLTMAPASQQSKGGWARADNNDTIEVRADDTGAQYVNVSSFPDGGIVVEIGDGGTLPVFVTNDAGNPVPVTDNGTHNLLNLISTDQLPPALGPQSSANSFSIVQATGTSFNVDINVDGGVVTVQGEGRSGAPDGGVLSVQGTGPGSAPLTVISPSGLNLAEQQQLPSSLDSQGQLRISGSGTTSSPTPTAAVLGGCGQSGNLTGLTCDGSGNLNVSIAASTSLTTIATNTGLVVPAASVATVTPNDGSNLPHVCRFLYLGGAGNLAVDLVTTGTDVVFVSAQQGYHAIQAQKVWSTGTTATGILCLY